MTDEPEEELPPGIDRHAYDLAVYHGLRSHLYVEAFFPLVDEGDSHE